MNGPLIVIVAGVAVTILGLGWLLLQHLRDRVDLVDVVTEWDDRRGRRKASLRKVGEAVALGASTFVLVFDAITPPANEWLLGLYLSAWVSRTLLGMLAQARAGAIEAASAKGARK